VTDGCGESDSERKDSGSDDKKYDLPTL